MRITQAAAAALCAAGLLAVAPSSAEAQLRSGFRSTLLPRGDDVFGAPAAFGFSIGIRGGTYTAANVCNNGFLAITGVAAGASCGFNLTLVQIADAHGTGIAGLSRDLNSTNVLSGQAGWGTGTVDGRAAWGATWDGVWNFGGTDASTANFFQIVLIDRSSTGAGNFDIEFNYGALATGTASAAGVADDGGFRSPRGEWAVTATADSRTVQCWRGGNLSTCPTVPPPPPPPPTVVPEPSTYALLGTGLALLAVAARRRARRDA